MFKFKIDPADIEKTKILIEQRFAQACNDPAMLGEIGKFTAERIRYQARIQQPINDIKRNPNLRASTIKRREYLAKYNNTDITYAASRSNLTLTGAFLNSFGFEISGAGEVTLSFKGQHPGYKGPKGPYKAQPLSNAQLSLYLADNGFRAFSIDALNASKTIKSRINAIVKAYLRRSLKLG